MASLKLNIQVRTEQEFFEQKDEENNSFQDKTFNSSFSSLFPKSLPVQLDKKYHQTKITHQFLLIAAPDIPCRRLIDLIKGKFKKLYPAESELAVSILRTHDNVDVDVDYKVSEIFDNGSFVIAITPKVTTSRSSLKRSWTEDYPVVSDKKNSTSTPSAAKKAKERLKSKLKKQKRKLKNPRNIETPTTDPQKSQSANPQSGKPGSTKAHPSPVLNMKQPNNKNRNSMILDQKPPTVKETPSLKNLESLPLKSPATEDTDISSEEETGSEEAPIDRNETVSKNIDLSHSASTLESVQRMNDEGSVEQSNASSSESQDEKAKDSSSVTGSSDSSSDSEREDQEATSLGKIPSLEQIKNSLNVQRSQTKPVVEKEIKIIEPPSESDESSSESEPEKVEKPKKYNADLFKQ